VNEAEWVIFAEGNDAETVAAALTDCALAPQIGNKPVRSAIYRLMVSLTRD